MNNVNLRLLTSGITSLFTLASVSSLVGVASAATKQCAQFMKDHRGIWIQACGKYAPPRTDMETPMHYDSTVFFTIAALVATIFGVWYVTCGKRQMAERRALHQTISEKLSRIAVILDRNPYPTSTVDELIDARIELNGVLGELIPTLTQLKKVNDLTESEREAVGRVVSWNTMAVLKVDAELDPVCFRVSAQLLGQQRRCDACRIEAANLEDVVFPLFQAIREEMGQIKPTVERLAKAGKLTQAHVEAMRSVDAWMADAKRRLTQHAREAEAAIAGLLVGTVLGEAIAAAEEAARAARAAEFADLTN